MKGASTAAPLCGVMMRWTRSHACPCRPVEPSCSQSVFGADRPADFIEADCLALSVAMTLPNTRWCLLAQVYTLSLVQWTVSRAGSVVPHKRHGQCVIFRFVGLTLHDGTSWPGRKDELYDTAACVVATRNSRLDAVALSGSCCSRAHTHSLQWLREHRTLMRVAQHIVRLYNTSRCMLWTLIGLFQKCPIALALLSHNCIQCKPVLV